MRLKRLARPGDRAQPDLLTQSHHLAPWFRPGQPDALVEELTRRERTTLLSPRKGRAPGQQRRGKPAPSGQQNRAKPAPSGRRYQIAGVLIAVMALITAGSLALALSGHTRAAARGGAGASQNQRAETRARNLAAAWVASQVSRTVMVSCDPVMCRALESHRVPANDLNELRPDTTSPLRAAVIVATPAVRAQFGSLLNSVYAPGVIASFGAGRLRIDIRQIAPHGAAAYRSQLNAGLQARKASGGVLMHTKQVAASATARRQLLAGQADSRLLIAIAAMASARPVYLVAFGDPSPGADATMPLRSAEVAEPGHPRHPPSRSVTPAFVQSMIKVLRAQRAPDVPAHIETVRIAAGQQVLLIDFTAPSPFGPRQP